MSAANIDPLFATAIVHAVKKGVNAENARDEILPGVYENISIDLSLKVASMRVAPDTDKTPTCSIPMLAAMALLVKRMGLQRDEALKTLREVMLDALELQGDAQSTLYAETGVKEAEELIRNEVIAKLPRIPVKGAVKVEDVEVTLRSMRVGE